MTGRSRVLALMALLVSAIPWGPVGRPASVRAAEPPPVDVCIAAGGWTLAPDDPCGRAHAPNGAGNQFGRITSVSPRTAAWGDTLTFTYGVDAPRALGEAVSCGDLGCIAYSVLWRSSGETYFEHVAGCGATDRDCTVRVWPSTGGTYDMMYAELYLGRNPQNRGTAFAVHVPRRQARLDVDVVSSDGTPVPLGRDAVAYAVRAGSAATTAACVGAWWGDRFEPSLPSPDCVRLQRVGNRAGGTDGFAGLLPVDSGSWIVVGAPMGDPGATLLARPSPFRSAGVDQDHRDQRVALVSERRPTAQVTVHPQTEQMSLGSTQDVRVTVTAADGEAGALRELVFADPLILSVIQGDPPVLEIVGIAEGAPAEPFDLTSGAFATWTVRLRAADVGSARVNAQVSGRDDLDTPTSDGEGGQIEVVVGPGADPGGGDGVQAPILTRAVDDPTGDGLEGTVTGAPGGSMDVTVWTSPANPEGGCVPSLDGPDVRRVGSTAVSLDDVGAGAFALDGELAEGEYVYGVAAVGPATSDVSECRRVDGPLPVVSVSDLEIVEGTNDGTTRAVLGIALDRATDRPVLVTVRTSDDTAVAPDDYAALDAIVEIPAGSTASQVVVAVIADAKAEADETFRVTLSNPEQATLASGEDTAVARIVDDDAAATPTLDVRGTWRGTKDPATTLVITDQDPASGRVVGVLTLPKVGKIQMSGSLEGRRLTLTGRNKEISGTMSGQVARKKGALAVTFTVKDSAGRTGTLPMRLADPAG